MHIYNINMLIHTDAEILQLSIIVKYTSKIFLSAQSPNISPPLFFFFYEKQLYFKEQILSLKEDGNRKSVSQRHRLSAE